MTTETQYEWVREACSSWEGNGPGRALGASYGSR